MAVLKAEEGRMGDCEKTLEVSWVPLVGATWPAFLMRGESQPNPKPSFALVKELS